MDMIDAPGSLNQPVISFLDMYLSNLTTTLI